MSRRLGLVAALCFAAQASAALSERIIRLPGDGESVLPYLLSVDDACPATPYHQAKRLESKHSLITVRGGDPQYPHGYFGVEARTVKALADWMLRRTFPRQVP